MKSAKTPFAILGALSMWPMSGYDIRKVLERGMGRYWAESYGQIYPFLKQLLARGSIRKSEEKGRGKPDRHVYSLTEKGRKELKEWLVRPAGPAPCREELLLKLFFGSQVEPFVCIGQIQRFRDYHRNSLRDSEQIEKSLVGAEESPDSIYWLITMKFSQHVSRALMAWCDEALALCKNIKANR